MRRDLTDTDGSSRSLEAIYQIFERLNAGGTQLTPHEIRVALYAGPFIDYLNELNHVPAWRSLYGKLSPRVRDQELVLRILALDSSVADYARPLKSFLNDFVDANRYVSRFPTADVKALFSQAAELLLEGPGRDILRPRGRQVNAALTEALMVGLISRIRRGSTPEGSDVSAAAIAVSRDPRVIEATTGSTADEEKVRNRVAVAIEHFATA